MMDPKLIVPLAAVVACLLTLTGCGPDFSHVDRNVVWWEIDDAKMQLMIEVEEQESLDAEQITARQEELWEEIAENHSLDPSDLSIIYEEGKTASWRTSEHP